LDRFAGIENDVRDYSKIFIELAEKRKTLESSLKSDREREERLELLNYAVDEITKAQIQTGEIRELEQEVQKLADFEKLIGYINTAAGCFIDGEISTADTSKAQSVLSLARRAKNALDSASAVDSGLGDLNRRFENLYYEAEDIAEEFRTYREKLAFDPKRLEDVNDRLALLYKLKKKYVKTAGVQGNEEEAVLSYKTSAEAEIEALCGAEENRENLKTVIGILEKEIVSKAAGLKEKRTAASDKIDQLITGILRHLGMPNACFKTSILPKSSFGQYGTEEVEFMISANKGEPLKELAKIASGGELSRVMLAIKTALLSDGQEDTAGVETLVFDEIDAGIGGEVALKVGEYLTKIGKFKQIFCVTHLASIAVRADNHFKVEKKTQGGRTYTGIGPLNADGRRKEIARMLAGDAGDAALAHADELIHKYGNLAGIPG